MAEYPFINNPGSGWHDTGPSSATVRRQMKTQTRQQLQQEAASLTPDANQLAEELMKYKISGGDRAQFVGELNGMMNQYLTSYNQNPYFAFTKQGRDLAKNVQRLVKHPMLAQLEQEYERGKETRKRIAEEGNLHNINVVNGKVSVFNSKTGEFSEKDADNIDYRNETPLTPEQLFNYKERRGYFNKNNPYSPDKAPDVSMASMKTVVGHLNDMLEGIGSTGVEKLTSNLQGVMGQLLGSKSDSNLNQLEKKQRAILSEAGMPSNYWDTLMSAAYTKYWNQNQKLPPRNVALNMATQTVLDLIDSRAKTDSALTEKPLDIQTKVKGLEKAGKEETVPTGFYESFLTGELGKPTHVGGVDPKNQSKLYPGMSVGPEFFNTQGLRGVMPYRSNPTLMSMAADSPIYVRYGDTPLDKNLTMPAPDTNVTIVRDDEGTKVGNPDKDNYWIMFDVFTAEKSIGDKADRKNEVRKVTDFEQMTIEGMLDAMEKAREKDPSQYYDDGDFFGYDTYYRVPVKIKYDPYRVSGVARTLFDKNSNQQPKEGVTLFKPTQPKIENPNTQRTAFGNIPQ